MWCDVRCVCSMGTCVVWYVCVVGRGVLGMCVCAGGAEYMMHVCVCLVLGWYWGCVYVWCDVCAVCVYVCLVLVYEWCGVGSWYMCGMM